MALVTGFTAARMLAIEEASVVSGLVDVNGDLILYTNVGTPIDAGNVIGPDGPAGAAGAAGADGPEGPAGPLLLGVAYPWFGDTIPTWGLELDGQAVSRTTFSGLYALWGNKYGAGDGTTTFNVPDLSDGRTPVGQGIAPFDVLGAVGGEVEHTHPLSDNGQAKLASGGSGLYYQQVSGAESWAASVFLRSTPESTTTSRSLGMGLMGATDSGSTLQPYIALNYIIKT